MSEMLEEKNETTGKAILKDKKKKAGKQKYKEILKEKQKKKKRLIVRNLSFQVGEDELKEIFSKYGNVVEVKIPLKSDGKKRGFAFVQFEETRGLIKAMKSLNYKEIHGRPIAIDFAIDKTSFQLKLDQIKQEKTESVETGNKNISNVLVLKPKLEPEETEIKDIKIEIESSEELDEDEKRVNSFLKEFDANAETAENSDQSSSDDSDDDDELENFQCKEEKIEDFDDNASILSGNNPNSGRKLSNDVSEGRTVFIRNVSFTTTEDTLRTTMQKYGESEYCLLCMDPVTDHPKGTAFIKFKDKESADKLIQETSTEPGVVVDGRSLLCSFALSQEELHKKMNDPKKPKDKRNLNLLRVSVIIPSSKEAEGVSKSDMAKRLQLEMSKKQVLRNVNFFVSDKRLAIHNLPESFTDSQLRKLFKEAAGQGAIITEARVMKEFKKTDAHGNPMSKGFGFVSFLTHEDALKALTELNNNPNVFTAQKRPIVEFSVENTVALLSKERRKEKMQMRNKKRTEEKRNRHLNQMSADSQQAFIAPTKGKKRKHEVNHSIKQLKEEEDDSFQTNNSNAQRKRPLKRRKKKKIGFGEDDVAAKCKKENDGFEPNKTTKNDNPKVEQKKVKRKRKVPKSKREKNKNSNSFDKQGLASLTDMYKKKLLNSLA